MPRSPTTPDPVEFGEINVVCRDVERSLGFYRDALGLQEVEREGDAVRLAIGGLHILLLPFAAEPNANAYLRNATIGFDVVVADAALVETLEAAGGRRVERLDGGEGWAVADPDGNVIEVLVRSGEVPLEESPG
jgi:catechol 2,3-dioxygenase-like lactoylglutathione lyase family enzyme